MAHHRAGRAPQAEALYRPILQANPKHPDALHLLGLIAHQTGNNQPAKDLVMQALRNRPDAPPFLNSLGIICLALDELDRAASALEKAIKLAPSYGEPHLNLGNLHRRRGDKPAAEQCFRRAIACNPRLVEAHNNLGTLLLELDRIEDALVELDAALALKPGDSQILCNLGTARDALGRDDAVDCFRQALAGRSDDVKALTGLGKLYIEREHVAEAAECFERALALQPAGADHRLNLASARAKQHRFDEARQLYQAAAAADPDRPAAHFGLGRLCVVLGEFDEARVHFRRAHELDPLDANAMAALLDDRNLNSSPEDRRQAELIVERAETSPRSRLYLHFSLAHAFERANLIDDAFRHFRTGNELRRKILIRQGKAYDPAAQELAVDRIIAQYDAAFFASAGAAGDDSELPVFIVGMPRSGTTLCEQILASHPRAFGAGELPDLSDLAARLDARRLEVAGDSVAADWRRQAERHVGRLRAMAPGALRVTDKAPANFLNLGLAATLFPRARIVHCVRSPLDSGLSCYAQNLGDHWPWACDLEWIAHYARQYLRLMDHWRAVLPVPFLDFDYESLIGDFEGRARRLVDFCGLPWAPQCADFHRTKRPVHTASLQQVRQPIYAGSVGKWRRYERHLRPLMVGLEKDG
ncbi:MAG: tetratricopeptide repeat-containing sulfotransferase family protein [Dongiaceae bacterium]